MIHDQFLRALQPCDFAELRCSEVFIVKKIILLTEGTSTYARDLLQGIAEYSRLNGPWAFYRETLVPFYRSRNQPKTFNHLKAWKADGVILRSMGPEMTQEALSLGLPTIACDDNNQAPDVPNVISNYQMAGTMAAEHLLSKGFKYFAYCGFDNMLWSRERGRYFAEALDCKGYEVFTYVQPKGRIDRLWEKELSILGEWIRSLPKPVAVMACNDDRANQIVICCNLFGFCIPEHVAILGVDNDQLLCDMTNPRLSSIALNTRKAGYKAAGLLHQMILGETPKEQVIQVHPTHIVKRRSTDTLAIADKDVVEAVQFIYKHARNPIQVSDVADAVALSSRSLFDKFNKHLGRSVSDEIKRARIEEISQLLLQTDLPIYKIAQCFHFSSIEHISRYFKQATRLTPLAYRKQYGAKSKSITSDAL